MHNQYVKDRFKSIGERLEAKVRPVKPIAPNLNPIIDVDEALPTPIIAPTPTLGTSCRAPRTSSRAPSNSTR